MVHESGRGSIAIALMLLTSRTHIPAVVQTEPRAPRAYYPRLFIIHIPGTIGYTRAYSESQKCDPNLPRGRVRVAMAAIPAKRPASAVYLLFVLTDVASSTIVPRRLDAL